MKSKKVMIWMTSTWVHIAVLTYVVVRPCIKTLFNISIPLSLRFWILLCNFIFPFDVQTNSLKLRGNNQYIFAWYTLIFNSLTAFLFHSNTNFVISVHDISSNIEFQSTDFNFQFQFLKLKLNLDFQFAIFIPIGKIRNWF